MAGGPFRPDGGRYSASVVLAELARLWEQAAHRMASKGEQVTQELLARVSRVPVTTVNSWAKGRSLPRNLDQLAAVGGTLAQWADDKPLPTRKWEEFLHADRAARGAHAEGGDGDQPGRLIAELTDPFALEVHRPVVIGPGGVGLPVLPPYVRRPHDDELAKIVRQAADGRSGMAVMVGGSSTGKTRACWEAVHLLPPGWRLWHPFDPTRPEAALAQLPQVRPRTVVWLNQTQLYLDASSDTAERISAALRTLLSDPGRAPVLVLGTLWPDHWDALTRDQAAHSQAHTVLAGTDIAVPIAFTRKALQDLESFAAADARLALAAKDARDGQITQFLAGVPELLARYRNAPPAARALIHAAMDACRLGHRLAVPHALLAAAAPAYLSETEWDAAGDNWLEQALAYAGALCKGVPGPLTRIRPGQVRTHQVRTGQESGDDQPVSGQAHDVSEPTYRLADYLDQHGRRHRASEIPPAGFWAAVAANAQSGDQTALAEAAHARGLYRDAAQLRKCATARGNPRAAASLVTSMHHLHPGDYRPADWAAGYAGLSDPYAVADLLGRLREAGADGQARTLLGRDPAGHADLSDPYAVADLLDRLREAGADGQARTLLGRDPAGHADLSDQYAVADLLDRLRVAGADEQARTLADRAAGHADLSDAAAVAFLLGRLREAGADEQARTLLGRDPAGHADLSDPAAVAVLLDSLREAGADEQARALADRAAGHADLSDPRAVAFLLGRLREAGADVQARALADRAAGHADLSDPAGVAVLLDSLREAAADEQARTLADRAAELADLSDPYAVADLLGRLREAGADEQAGKLLGRDPAGHADLSGPAAVAVLLDSLREAGADEQAGKLLGRDPARNADLSDPYAVAELLDRLREAGADEHARTLAERAAEHADLSDPAAVAVLLGRLREAGADEQARMLAERAAEHADLGDAAAVAFLLGRLREAGADEQARTLLGRDPAGNADLSDPAAVAVLLDSLREAGADQQARTLLGRDPAGNADLSDPAAAAVLLDRLREAGADEQARTLIDRLSATGRFRFFQEYFGPRFRFGREQDGQPAEFWGWDDLG